MDEQRGTERIPPSGQTSFGEEREKFFNHLISLGSLAVEMAVVSRELKRLHEESDLLHAEVRALKAQLNETAVQVGLQPLQ